MVAGRQALKGCDKVVLCGYSLLPVDERVRNLMLDKPRKETRIEVISGNQTQRIANHLDAADLAVEAFQGGYFADWCKANQISS